MKYVPAGDEEVKKEDKYKVKKLVAKYLFVLLALASFYGNYHLAKMSFNFKCDQGGYFTTKSQCDEFAKNKMVQLEASREAFIQDNQDLFN